VIAGPGLGGSVYEDGPVGADGEQGELFPDASVPDELVGYRGPAACQIAGITYRGEKIIR